MNKPMHPAKKPYTPPRLRRYGDLRRLTKGGVKQKDEANQLATPKTRADVA